VRTVWRLALAAAIVAYGGVIIGSWVRITGAGMSCPDWPLCHGSLLPSIAGGTLWEWSHRLVALFETPLVVTLVVMAWPLRKKLRPVAPMLGVVVALFILQVFLGAATVRLANAPLSVVLHWGTAMAFLGALVALTIFIRAPGWLEAGSPSTHRALFALLSATALLAFVTMCVGAYVSSSGAGLACVQLPGCAGEMIVYGSSQFVQMAHRAVAGICLLTACATAAIALRYGSRSVRDTTCAGLALLFAQVFFGLLNVAWRLPLLMRELHSAMAALAFLTFIAALAMQAMQTSASRLKDVAA